MAIQMPTCILKSIFQAGGTIPRIPQYTYPSRTPPEIPTSQMCEEFAVVRHLPYSTCTAQIHTIYPQFVTQTTVESASSKQGPQVKYPRTGRGLNDETFVSSVPFPNHFCSTRPAFFIHSSIRFRELLISENERLFDAELHHNDNIIEH